MSKNRQDLKILYMQIRKDEITKKEEFAGFKRFMKLDEDQFTVWNVFEQPNFDLETLSKFDAMVIGGSSDDPKDSIHFDPEEYPFIEDVHSVIQACYDQNIPVSASCMGFLIAIQALGSEIEFDKSQNEDGFADVHLTEDGKKDVLLQGVPDTFTAVSFHDKSAIELPEGATLLMKTDKCPRAGFTFTDKPFYAFQFHPEFDDEDLIRILGRYADRYPGGKEAWEKCKEQRRPTTEANNLLEKFVDRIVLEQE